VRGLAVCLDGVQDEELISAASGWATRFEWVEVWCAYGDEAARELEHVREHHGRPPKPPPPHHNRAEVDREQAEAIVARGAERMRLAPIEPRQRTLSGRDAGHALAAASGSEVALFLAAGHRGGVGPHSVGHVARFVIDHARGPIIVVRL
jgi:hypothetical protein